MKNNVFTAQDARNIVEVDSTPNLGKIIDAIKAGAAKGFESLNIEKVPIKEEILETLKERGFEVTDKEISWGLNIANLKNLKTNK